MPGFALQMRQISKSYGGFKANNRITLEVTQGTIHALAGENGAGKSTLMKILFGLVEADFSANPDEGIFLKGKRVQFKSPLDAISAGIGMVQQHFALAGPLTALDNVVLGAEPKRGFAVDRAAAKTTLVPLAGDLLQVPWASPVEDLSVGFQQRIEILKLLFRKADILILDEPTAVLTPVEVESFFSLLRKLRAEGKTILLITHKLQEVLSLCDEVTVLRNGEVTGRFSSEGLTRQKIVHAMIGRDPKPVTKTKTPVKEKLVEIQDVTVDLGSRGSLKNVTFEVQRGEIVGIAGVDGNGQQALVEGLLGLRPHSGKIFYNGSELKQNTAFVRRDLNFGLISEDRHEQSLWLDASIADNSIIGFGEKLSSLGILRRKKIQDFARETLKGYEVKMTSLDLPVRFLSGGNQQKIVIAREVNARRPHFLIASQPTRGVDVGAIEFIHRQLLNLQENGAGILLISSELEELCTLSDRILVLYEGKIAAEYKGPGFDLKKIGEAMTSGAATG